MCNKAVEYQTSYNFSNPTIIVYDFLFRIIPSLNETNNV